MCMCDTSVYVTHTRVRIPGEIVCQMYYVARKLKPNKNCAYIIKTIDQNMKKTPTNDVTFFNLFF
jgi:hypothetical protein